jgi:hypothetical protein
MTRRALYLGIFAVAILALGGCKKLLHKATGSTADICALLTDAEIESAMSLKIVSHKGAEGNCEWNLGSPTEPGLVTLMKSSAGAEAILNATLGKGTPVAGVGDSAMWLGGMMPILVVHAKGDIYRLTVMSPPLMKSMTSKTVVLEKHATGPNSTIEKDAVSLDFPQLLSGAETLAKAFIGRL